MPRYDKNNNKFTRKRIQMNLSNRILKEKTMFTRRGLIFLCLTAWMTMDVKVEAYLSGCSGGYCFLISDISHASEFLDQTNAQQRCLSNGSQLVEILNQDIQKALVNFITGAYTQGLNNWNVLINGKRTSSSTWKRLSGYDAGGLTVYDQTDQSYAYGYLKSTASVFDLFASRPTKSKEGFICSGLKDCSGGATISGQCYKSFTETLSWYDARNRCLDAGGDLASFENITSNTGFNALNGSWISTSNSYWIGIRREWWTWQTTSSDVKYSDWLSGHPINDAGRVYSDCLCLSTTEWKWIECGCTQLLPFVCISLTPTTTTIKTTPPASRSTTTYSAVVSENNGVSSPTDTTTGTLKSTGNDTGGGVQQPMAGSGAVIGIGVGVGVGGALIVIALIAAVIILCRKRCPFRCPERKKAIAKPQPPDILMKDGTENPYAHVVSSTPELNDTDPTIVYTSDSQTHTVYAPIGFCTEPQVQHDGNVTIVAGKTQPSPVTIPPKNNAAAKHFKVGGDLYAEVTKA